MHATNEPSRAPLRVGIIGARRVRQGTGPYLARFFADCGCRIGGVAGTGAATARAAARALEAEGVPTRPFEDPEQLVHEGALDVLVIASPSGTHDRYLELAASQGLHVLCEKPLCWGGEDPADRARRHAQAFLARNLHLAVQAQWPYTLPSYEALFPGVLASGWTRFRMDLSPSRPGRGMIPDALPHALSLLAALLPDPAAHVVDPAVEILGQQGERARVRFAYRARGREIEAEVRLDATAGTPRPAAYAFDGRLAHRRIDPATYRMALEGDGTVVAMPDPTPLLVQAFVSRVRSAGRPQVDPAAVPGMEHLVRIADAWDAQAA